MAAPDNDTENRIDIGKIPILDLRCLCQDEIRHVAQLSGDFVEANLVHVEINKSIFNESAGSRRQTYARDRIPRRGQTYESKHRLPWPSDSDMSPLAQIRRSVATDSKEKRSLRENQDLILRICRQLQKEDQERLLSAENPQLVDKGNSSFDSLNAAKFAKDNADSPAFKGFRASIIAGGELISVIQPRKDDICGQNGSYKSATEAAVQLREAESQQRRSILRLKRLKRIARACFTDGQDASANGTEKEFRGKSRVGKLRRSGRMKTREEEEDRTVDHTEIALKKLQIASEAPSKETRAPRSTQTPAEDVQIKVMDAQGFPRGWKVYVDPSKRGAAKFMKFLSPDGQEWSSLKEALIHAGSVVDINVSTQTEGGLKPSGLNFTIAGSIGHMTEASHILESHNAKVFVKSNKRNSLGHALCAMCGKTFANQFSLRRHMSTIEHAADQASGPAIETTNHGMMAQGESNDKCVQDSNDVQHGTAIDREEKAREMKRVLVSSTVEGNYECRACGKLFTSKRKYLSHLKSHSPNFSHIAKVRRFESSQNRKGYSKKRYVEYPNRHFRNSRKKLGRRVGKTFGRTNGKVMSRPVGRPRKSTGAGELSDAFTGRKKYNVVESKIGVERELKSKPLEGEFTRISHKDLKKGKKRRHEQPYLSRRVRFREGGTVVQDSVEKASSFACQECGKEFYEHARYTGHLSLHSRMRKKCANGTIHGTMSEGKQTDVASEDDKGYAFYSKESSTRVFMRLLADRTGSCHFGLPAKVLFAQNMSALNSQKSREEHNKPVGPHQYDGVHSISQADILQGENEMGEKLRHDGDSLNSLNEGWSTNGCTICGCIGNDNAHHVVCNWCDREFHQSCLIQGCLVTSASWVCLFCNTVLRNPQRVLKS